MCAKLLGIEHSNHSNEDLWSKNVFNSTFPVAFANYLWKCDPPQKVKYVTTDANFNIVIDEIGVDELFNCNGLTAEELYFSFEDVYTPYEKFLEGGFGSTKRLRRAKKIDLVVKQFEEDKAPEDYKSLRALEIKMTVVPDNSTINTPDNPGSEIVIRPTTTLYAALGLLDQCKFSREFANIKETLHDVWITLSNENGWEHNATLTGNSRQMKAAIAQICRKYHKKQIPLLLQPIWKTNAQDHELDKEHALDLIAWSNLAYVKLFLTKVPDTQTDDPTACRAARCLSKFIQYLYIGSGSSDIDRRINLGAIKVPEGYQTDKELSVNGAGTREFITARKKRGGKNDTYYKPRFPRKILHSIILNGGEKRLKPERRFDQSIYIMEKTGLYNSGNF